MVAAINIYLEPVKAICPELTDDELALFASKLTIKEQANQLGKELK